MLQAWCLASELQNKDRKTINIVNSLATIGCLLTLRYSNRPKCNCRR